MQHGRVLETKFVNALVSEAVANEFQLPLLSKSNSDAVWSIVRWFKSYYRGLWVGGEVKITDTHLVFEPNYVNKLAHTGDTSFAVSLKTISGVTVEPGILTKIIAIATPERVYRIRCFGAKAFRDRIARRANIG